MISCARRKHNPDSVDEVYPDTWDKDSKTVTEKIHNSYERGLYNGNI